MAARKPKQMKSGNKNKSNNYDRCQTPDYALDPLLKYIKKSWTIWESASGQNKIVNKLMSEQFEVVSSDILSNQNFFQYEPNKKWDCQITNPPYSIKYKWIERSYWLNKPFALLMPLETIGTASGQNLFKKYGIQIILLSRRVNFYMPNKGYTGGGAQFPVAWFTWKLNLKSDLVYENLIRYPDKRQAVKYLKEAEKANQQTVMEI